MEKKMISYIAVVHKDKHSAYGISFPDFFGCISFADNLDDVQKNAAEALELHISGIQEDGEILPAPTSLENCHDKTAIAYLLVPVAAKKPNSVRFNATMEQNLLKKLDNMARAKGTNRSAMLAELVKQATKSKLLAKSVTKTKI